MTGGRLTTIEVGLSQELAVQPGDRVLLSLDPADLLRASLLAYGLPLFSTAAALGLLRLFSGIESDLIALGTAFTGLVAGLFAGRLLLRRSRRCARTLAPTIRRVATAADAADPST